MKHNLLKYAARTLRKTMTCHEQILWQNIRKNKISGFQFYRQKVIAGYIVDFYCAAGKLVIELDGKQHKQKLAIEYDTERTKVLQSLGLTVMRFDNLRVEMHINAVLDEITKQLEHHPTQPHFQGREEQAKKVPLF